MSIHKLTISSLILLFSFCLSSQEINYGLPTILNYSPKEYGAHAQNWAIIQDNRGIIYIGNTEGLLEFDGYNWRKIYTTNKSAVRSLAIDSSGTIYVGAIGEFGYLKPNNLGEIEYISLLDKIDPKDRSFNDVWETYTINQTVYFRTSKSLIALNKNEGYKVWYPNNNVFNKAILFKNKLYIREREHGLLTLKNDTLIYAQSGKKYKTDPVYDILDYHDNKIFITSLSEGIVLYDTILNNFYNLDRFKKLNNFLKLNRVICAIKIDSTKIAFGTSLAGVVLTDIEGNILQYFNKKNGLQNEVIRNLFCDKYKNLWIATNNGISYINTSTPVTLFNSKQGLQGTVNTIVTHENTLFAGTSYGIFYLKNNEFHQIKGLDRDAWSLLSFKSQSGKSKLIAGTNNGIYEVNADTTSQILFTGVPLDLIQSSFDSSLLIAGIYNNQGLVILKNNGNNWNQLKIPEEVTNEQITMVCQENHGRIWLSTVFNGIISISPVMNEPIHNWKVKKYNRNHGLPQLKSISIYKYNNQVIFSTKNGWLYFNDSTGLFVNAKEIPFTVGSTGVNYFATDNNRNFVISFTDDSQNWIDLLSINNKNKLQWNPNPFKPYTSLKAEGSRTLIIDKNSVWVGTSEGLLHYNKNSKKDYSQGFNTIIRKISLNQDSIIYLGGGNIADAQNTDGFIYKNNNITFEYAATYYESKNSIKYSYCLEGIDKKWSSWVPANLKEYTNLNHGAYNFKVKAKNVYDVESPVITYTFTIKPPVHLTTVAYIFYLIVIGLIIYLILFLNSRRLKAINIKLENIIDERTREISHKNEALIKQKEEIITQNQEIHQQNEEIKAQTEKLQEANNKLIELDRFKESMTGMIVHDLKNPLNTIIGLTKNQTIKQAGQQMLNMVLNILDVQKFENAKINLDIKNISLNELIEKAISQVNLLLDRKSIELVLNIDKNLYLSVDRDIIRRVFINILTNAIKHNPNNGQIKIESSITNNPEFLRVSFTDKGQGIPKDMLPVIFDKFTQVVAKKSGFAKSTGIGLTFCKLAVESHGGTIGVESEIGKGSTFWFELPISKGATNNQPASTNKIPDYETYHKVIDFSESEINFLTPFIESLKKYTVYEFSDLSEILQQINAPKSQSIQIWKSELENSIRACNEEKFEKLINIRKK